MDAIKILNLILRLAIWFLLTADLSLPNIMIGIAIALLLPGNSKKTASRLKDWLEVFWKIIIAIPQAYFEAIQIMLQPHNEEDIVKQKVKQRRASGLVFLDIFLITFTPKTIVTNYDESGWYEIHRVKRKINSK